MSAYDTAISAILGNPIDPNRKPSRQDVVQAFLELTNAITALQGLVGVSLQYASAPARVKTTANVNLAGGGIANGTTHDGVVVATGDKILVGSQTAGAENGPYIVPVSGAASRATDGDIGTELVAYAIGVTAGTANGGKFFYQKTPGPIILGTTVLVFNQLFDMSLLNATEAAARIAADNAEAATRAGADTTETNARIAADSAEATTRAGADTTETNARIAADVTLTTNLNNEVNARTTLMQQFMADARTFPGEVNMKGLFTSALTGAASSRAALTAGAVSVSDALGASLEIIGTDITATGLGYLDVAVNVDIPLDHPNIKYRLKWTVEKSQDSVDPVGEGLDLRWQSLDKNKAVISQTRFGPLQTGGAPIPDGNSYPLTVANGVLNIEMVVGCTAGTGVDYVVPANCRYGTVFVRMYHTTGKVRIGCIACRDVTNTAAFSAVTNNPHITELTALTGVDRAVILDDDGSVQSTAISSFGRSLIASNAANDALALLGQLPWMQAVTSCYIHTDPSASPHSMSFKKHVAKTKITSLKMLYATWIVNAPCEEKPLGNALPMSAWVIYPKGVWNRVLFRGLAKPTLPDDTTTESDELFINIPEGAEFIEAVRCYAICPTTAQGGSANYTVVSHAGGEGSANQNLTANVPDEPIEIPGGKERFYGTAIAILARTTIPSIYMAGDSRLFGANANPDRLSNDGAWAQGLGSIAYANYGVSGDAMNAYLSGRHRRALLQYFTHVGNEYGVNHWAVMAASNAESLITDHLRAQGRFKGKKLFRGTMEPYQSADLTRTVAVNQWIRMQINGVPYIELADGASTAHDSGTWLAGYTDGDLLHANVVGTAGILAAGGIKPATVLNAPVCNVDYVPVWTASGAAFAGGYLTAGALSAYGILPGTQPFRLECIVNWTVAGGAIATIFGINTILGLKISTAGQVSAFCQALTIAAGAGTAITSGADHHIALVCNGAGLYLYIDGVLVGSALGTLGKFQTPFAAFAIGGNGQVDKAAPTLNAGWTMKIKEFSSHLIGQFFNVPTIPYVGTETGLCSLWHGIDTSIIMGPELTGSISLPPDPSLLTVPAFAIYGPFNVIEGKTAVYTVTRFGFMGQACSVTATVSGITAVAADFVGAAFPSSVINFGADEYSKTFSVSILDAVLYRNARKYKVSLSAPSNSGTIDTISGVNTTITDDDQPAGGASVYTLVPPAPSIEGTTQVWTINRTGTTTTETISWKTTAGPWPTAATADFSPSGFPTGSVTFNPGDASKTFNVVTLDDAIVESYTQVDDTSSGVLTIRSEYYRAYIYNNTNGGVFAVDNGIGEIQDND